MKRFFFVFFLASPVRFMTRILCWSQSESYQWRLHKYLKRIAFIVITSRVRVKHTSCIVHYINHNVSIGKWYYNIIRDTYCQPVYYTVLLKFIPNIFRVISPRNIHHCSACIMYALRSENHFLDHSAANRLRIKLVYKQLLF